jgi:hypothetical protein
VIFSFLKLLMFAIFRPLALYRIYTGAFAMMMVGPLQEAEILEQELRNNGGESVALITEDQRQIEGMFFSPEKLFPGEASQFNDENRPTVLFCLGRSMYYQLHWDHYEYYLKQGLNVMVFNYGGYRNSEGSPTAERTFADAEAAYGYVKDTVGTDDSRIIVHGISLGGGPSSYLASQHPVHLVLDRTFSRVGDVSEVSILAFLTNFMYPYEVAGQIKDFRGRIHIFESTNDEIMYPKHVEEIFNELVRVRYPEASESSRESLRMQYVSTLPGGHDACALVDDRIYDNQREHFTKRMIDPLKSDGDT